MSFFGIDSLLTLILLLVIIVVSITASYLTVTRTVSPEIDEKAGRREFFIVGAASGIFFTIPLGWWYGYNNGEQEAEDAYQQRIDDLRENHPSMMTAPQIFEYEFEGIIESGDYVDYKLNLNDTTAIFYSMRSEHHISVLIIDEEKYDEYKQDRGVSYKALPSSVDTTLADVEETLPEGTYRCILDNTRREHSDDPRNTRVKFAIRGYSHS